MLVLTRAIDRLSDVAAAIAMVMVIALIGIMLYEVFARYVLRAPTFWAFDLSFMLNGMLFILAAGYTLKQGAHIRIDFLSQSMPPRVQHLVNFLFFALFFLPALGLLTHVAGTQTLAAFQTGRRELSSAWGPLIWPFYAGLTLGCAALWLQALADTARFAIGIRHPDRVPAPGQGAEPSPKP